jgi:hypothetical protein
MLYPSVTLWADKKTFLLFRATVTKGREQRRTLNKCICMKLEFFTAEKFRRNLSPPPSTLKMEAASPSERSVTIYVTRVSQPRKPKSDD